jgi:general secretion pathway protein J
MMAALAVSTMLIGGVWQLFHIGLQVYQRGVHNASATQDARQVLAIISRDIQEALAVAMPQGIHGTDGEQSTRTGTILEADGLDLETRAVVAARLPILTLPAASTTRVYYELEVLEEQPILRLRRRVAAGDGAASSRLMTLSEQVQRFRLRYFDGQDWSDNWQRASLPRAVEVSLVLQTPGRQARLHRFTTMVTAD